MNLKKILASLLALFFLCAHAQERILNFDAKIQIEKSGTIQVIETITIKAEGDQFKHGLLRILPLERKDKNGNRIDVEYTINSVKKNGNVENYFTKNEDDDWKIYIGNKEIYLENGVYEYQISYSTPFQVGYFDTYDEIYWNVTGNGWELPIDKVSCQIYLPSENNKFQNVQCYTGLSGSKASDCISSLNENNTIASFSASNLQEKEGLSVATSFSKGIIAPPTTTQKSISFYKQIKTNLWSVIFGIGMSIFFFFSWKKHGKDPSKKTIIPEFRPPFDWSPAVISYVYKQEFSSKSYMASLINIAVKGAMKICSTVEKGIFTNSNLYEIEIKNKNIKTLSLEEDRAFNYLSKKDKLLFSRVNFKIFDNAYSAWIESLEKQINLEDFYQNNTRKKWIGFFVLVIAGVAFEVLSKNKGYVNYPFFTVLIIASSALVYWFSKKIESTGQTIIRFVLGFFILVPTVFIFFVLLFYLDEIQMAVIGAIVLVYIFYAWNLGAYTVKGADAIEKIEGFKLYLETAEKDRMNMLNPPELTPQLFEELFPYAIALGVEIDWGKQFEEILELAKYNPEWCQGEGDFYRRPMFISSFNNSVSSSKIDPTPPASSSSSSDSGSSGSSGSWSSGSSGGGSSGGGGGGGGGGGW
jgi:uncharacterized membrane protein YgcG